MVSIVTKKYKQNKARFCLSPVKDLRDAVPEVRTKQFLNGATPLKILPNCLREISD